MNRRQRKPAIPQGPGAMSFLRRTAVITSDKQRVSPPVHPHLREQLLVIGRHHPVRPIEMASRGSPRALRLFRRIDAEDDLRHLLIASSSADASRNLM